MMLSEIPPRFGLEILRDATFATLGTARHEEDALLVLAESAELIARVATRSNVAAVVTTKELAERVPEHVGIAVATDPRSSFYRFHHHLVDETNVYWEPFDTQIAATARIHPRAFVAEKNVRIGARCVVGPNATILERVTLDEDVVIGANTVIGSDGFLSFRDGDRSIAVRNGGGVHLARGVEIRVCCAVQRGMFSEVTILGEDVATDDHVHIAHGCEVGRRSRIAASALLSSGARLGEYAVIGPGAAIDADVTIGARAHVMIGAVVTRDVEEDEVVSVSTETDRERDLEFVRAMR